MILDHTSELVWPVIEGEILHFVQDDSVQQATGARLSNVR
jgi:hypothetical protein